MSAYDELKRSITRLDFANNITEEAAVALLALVEQVKTDAYRKGKHEAYAATNRISHTLKTTNTPRNPTNQ